MCNHCVKTNENNISTSHLLGRHGSSVATRQLYILLGETLSLLDKAVGSDSWDETWWNLYPLINIPRGSPAGRQTPRADPATINPLEQFAIFLLGFRLGFIRVKRIHRPHGKIRHISIRVSCRVFTIYTTPRPHGTINHTSTSSTARGGGGSFRIGNL